MTKAAEDLSDDCAGCDEYGNGCGCSDCEVERADRRRVAAEWREALGEDLWARLHGPLCVDKETP